MNIYPSKTVSKKLRKTKKFLLDLIFPKFCVGCQTEGAWVCELCRDKIVRVKTQVCPECGKISELGKYCLKCKKEKSLSGVIVSAYYSEGPIKEAIHNLKYNHVLELGEFLGKILSETLSENQKALGKELLLVASPMHFWRKAQRGYNQAEVLADEVSSKLKIEKNYQILIKIRKTNPQVKLEGKKRRENLKNCYEINKNFSQHTLCGRTVVIVDDVTTTGTTLNACARVLKKAGAKKVWGLVVAKG